MPVNHEGHHFHNWTPARKVKFVGYRFAGMSTEWAVYWATVDRTKEQDVFTQREVNGIMRDKAWPHALWMKPMTGYDASMHMPPQELFDQLKED